MKLCETTYVISDGGELLIPAEAITEMGLKPGDPIYVAYLSNDGASNEFKEFLLTQEGAEQTGKDYASIQIPAQLLEQANIAADTDIQIICLDGIIIICRGTSLEIRELEEIAQRLKTAHQVIDFYGFEHDLTNVCDQLGSFINQLEEGESQ